jgi:hypothetical protein
MNIYLKPLVNKLMILWLRMEVEDISKSRGSQLFEFHVIACWTMQDFSSITLILNLYIYLGG